MSVVGKPDYKGAMPGDENTDNLPTQTEPTPTPDEGKGELTPYDIDAVS